MFKEFTQDEIARFAFIDDQHPAQFVLFKGELKGEPVVVLCWLDTENQQIRPWAIMLNDEHMPNLKLKDIEIVKDGD